MRILITGASHGLGYKLAQHFLDSEHLVWGISRSKPDFEKYTHWNHLSYDLSDMSSIASIREIFKDQPLDLILHCAGTWETSEDLSSISTFEIQSIIDVNLTSFLGLAIGLEASLIKGDQPLILAIGSTAALDHSTGPRAVYAASKFGLRGAIHGLREYYRSKGVRTTLIHPGGIAATESEYANRIPASDFIQLIYTFRQLSPSSMVKELTLPAFNDSV